MYSFYTGRSGSVVELPPCDRKVVSSSSARAGRVKSKTLKYLRQELGISKLESRVFRMGPYKWVSRVAVGVAHKRPLTAESRKC